LNGSFTYTPAAGFSGTDQFVYQVSDGQFLSQLATVTITVRPAAAAASAGVLSAAAIDDAMADAESWL
jgi:hypothetical protein